jgi:hypothetical protein
VQPSCNAAEELLVVDLRCDRNKPAQQTDNQVRLWINRLGGREQDLNAGRNQQYPKEDDDRLVLQKDRTKGDKDHAEEQSAQDAEEQNAVLVLRGDSEELKDHNKNKDVVQGQ